MADTVAGGETGLMAQGGSFRAEAVDTGFEPNYL